MFGRIARTSRRVAFGGALLILFIALGWATGLSEVPAELQYIDGAVEIAVFLVAVILVILILIGAPAIVLATLAPGMLPLIDLVAMSLVVGVPLTLLMRVFEPPYWTYCIGLFAIYLVLQRIFYGPWLGSFRAKNSKTYKNSFEVPEAPDAVWARLAPLPENAKSYYWPKAEFSAPSEGSDADFVLTSPRRKGLQDSVEAVWIENLDPGRTMTIRSQPLNGGASVQERYSLTVSPVGPRTRVEIENTFVEASAFQRFRVWLNNDANDFGASLKNRALGRRDGSVHGRQVLPA